MKVPSSAVGSQPVGQVFKNDRKAFFNSLPKALRNFKKAPALSDLKEKASAVGRAEGGDPNEDEDDPNEARTTATRKRRRRATTSRAWER